MDGFIMKKMLRRILICCTLCMVCLLHGLFMSMPQLSGKFNRVSLSSDPFTMETTVLTLPSKEAVMRSMLQNLRSCSSREDAVSYLDSTVPKISRLVKSYTEYFTGRKKTAAEAFSGTQYAAVLHACNISEALGSLTGNVPDSLINKLCQIP